MKTARILLIIIAFAFFLMLNNTSHGQTVVFSSWASAQVLHAVQVDKPEIKYDTVRTSEMPPFDMEIMNTFKYKDFKIEIVKNWRGCKLVCISGSTRVVLRPEDEYDILEKLIPLTQ